MARVDELNNLRSMPYEEYFGEMELADEEKEKRIELAERLEPHFLFLFAIVGISTADYMKEMLNRRYTDTVSEFFGDEVTEDSYMGLYIRRITSNIVDVTIQHTPTDTSLLTAADAYYTSADRAIFLSENESNAVSNYYLQLDAIKAGFTKKTWITMRDRKVRHTHVEVDSETIGIFQPFTVGNSLMMFPKDASLGADDKEIVNCRCSLHYS